MERMPIIDLHEDIKFGLENAHIFPENLRDQTSFEQLELTGVKLVVASSFIAPEGTDYSVGSTETNADELDWYGVVAREKKWDVLLRKGDLESIFLSHSEQHGLLMHVEGLFDFKGMDEDWANLAVLYEKGMRSLGMMWNTNSPLGSGAYGSEGLSDVGKRVLEWCQTKGVLADLSHMNDYEIADAADALDGPLVVTHAGARALCDRKRNLSDDSIRLVGDSGGVIGVYVSQSLLCSSDDTHIGLLIDHMEYIRDHAGSDAVAIGSDFGGIDAKRVLDGMDSVLGLQAIGGMLQERGWKDQDVEMVLWKNAYRVLHEVLPEE